MRNSVFWWVLIGFMILLDFYFFQALKTITQTASSKARLIIFICYWSVSISALVLLLLLPYLNFENYEKLSFLVGANCIYGFA